VTSARTYFQKSWLWDVFLADGSVKSVLDSACYSFDEGCEMAFGKVCFAGGDHIGVIAFMFKTCARCKSDIPLLSDIKRVTGFRHQTSKVIRARKRSSIGRIRQNINNVRKHKPRLDHLTCK